MFTRFDHVAIAVRSLEQASGFYREVLGMAPTRCATVEDQGVRAALFPIGHGELELLEPVDPAGGVARFLERRGEGLHHVCVEVPDVSAAVAHAMALGLPLIDPTPRPSLAGMIAFLHPKASHGVLVELAQPLTPPAPSHAPSGGVRAESIATVFVAVGDAIAAAATYARNFRGKIVSVQDDPYFASKKVEVCIGDSRVTLIGSADRISPVGCFLAERGEGLFGICLRVEDFEGALGYLEEAGIPTEVHGRATMTPLALLDPTRANGVSLFLCPAPSAAAVHIPAG